MGVFVFAFKPPPLPDHPGEKKKGRRDRERGRKKKKRGRKRKKEREGGNKEGRKLVWV